MKRILVVDDEKNIRTLFRDELEEEGYAIESAGSGREALENIAESVPDLVLLDIRMEDMTECVHVREQLGELTVLAETEERHRRRRRRK